jgi:hypothetical protein
MHQEQSMPRRRPKGKPGRKSRYTPDVALKLGVSFGRNPRAMVRAAAAAGVGYVTLYDWLKRGKAGDPRYATFAAIAKPPGPPPVKLRDWLKMLRGGIRLPPNSAGPIGENPFQ